MSNFVYRSGLITVEYLPSPTWLIRKRATDAALMTAYDWVANLTYNTPEECEVKGYLAGKSPMTGEDYTILRHIGGYLNFDRVLYSRYTPNGEFRKEKIVATLRGKRSIGQFRPLNCGEVKMATKSYRVTAELINDETGKVQDTLIHCTSGRTNKEIRVLQNLLKKGYQEPLEAIGDKLAEEQG